MSDKKLNINDIDPKEIEEVKPLNINDLDEKEFKDVSEDIKKMQDVGWFDAISASAAHGLTAGYSDEMIAKMYDMFDDERDYEEYRDLYRERLKAVKEKYPWISYPVDIGASIVGPGKLAKGAKGLMAVGAAEGLGRSEAELAGEDKEYGRAALDTTIGAGTGGIAHYAPGVGTKAYDYVAPAARATTDVAKGVTKKVGKKMLDKAPQKVKDAFDSTKLREEVIGLSKKERDEFLRQAGDEGSTVARQRTQGLQDRPVASPVQQKTLPDGRKIEVQTGRNMDRYSTKDIFEAHTKPGLLKNVNKKIEEFQKKYDDIFDDAFKKMSEGEAIALRQQIINGHKQALKEFIESKPAMSANELKRLQAQSQEFIDKVSKYKAKEMMPKLRALKNDLYEKANPRNVLDNQHPDAYMPLQRDFAKKSADDMLEPINESIFQMTGHTGQLGKKLQLLRQSQDRLMKSKGAIAELIEEVQNDPVKYGAAAAFDYFVGGPFATGLMGARGLKKIFESDTGKLFRAKVGDDLAEDYFKKTTVKAVIAMKKAKVSEFYHLPINTQRAILMGHEVMRGDN